MNLSYLIRATANKYANRTAIIDGSTQLTFRQFNDTINRLANGLSGKLNLSKGERVGILLNNCHQYMVSRLALEKLGVIWVPLNTLMSESDLAAILYDADVRALISEENFFSSVAKIISEKSLTTVWIENVPSNLSSSNIYTYDDLIFHSSAGEPDDESLKMSDICSINYTSGTSGKPKGVVLCQGNWINVYKNMLVDRDIKSDDVLAHFGPLTHASGSYFMPYYLRGASNVIVPTESADRIKSLLETIQNMKVTAFSCVPTVIIRILNRSDLHQYNVSTLRNIAYGAAPMPVEVIKKAVKIFGPILTQNYGQTEGYMTICTLPKNEHILEGSDKIKRRLGSVGRPYTFVEVRVVDNQGRDVKPGEAGEIIVRSEHVMQGYWNIPEETEKVLKNGWLYTGDGATVDEDGYVFLLDRLKEMIISGGFNIYPREIEDALYEHSMVLEAAVIGIPDSEWGEIVKAFVTLKSGSKIGENDLRDYCKTKIGFKAPKIIKILSEMPKNAYGKTDKKLLRSCRDNAFQQQSDCIEK